MKDKKVHWVPYGKQQHLCGKPFHANGDRCCSPKKRDVTCSDCLDAGGKR